MWVRIEYAEKVSTGSQTAGRIRSHLDGTYSVQFHTPAEPGRYSLTIRRLYSNFQGQRDETSEHGECREPTYLGNVIATTELLVKSDAHKVASTTDAANASQPNPKTLSFGGVDKACVAPLLLSGTVYKTGDRHVWQPAGQCAPKASKCSSPRVLRLIGPSREYTHAACVRLFRHENIPTCPASNWPVTSIYPHVLHPIVIFA